MAQVVTNPLWVAKTRLQTQHMELKWRRATGPMYTGAFNTLWRMAREEGLHGLYRCAAPGLLVEARAVQCRMHCACIVAF